MNEMAADNPGSRLRRLRQDAGLTLEELAGRVDVAVATLQFWETTPGRLKRGNPVHRVAVQRIASVLAIEESVVWDPPLHVREGQTPYRKELVPLIAAFLAKIAWSETVPQQVRDEAKELLRAMEDDEDSQ